MALLDAERRSGLRRLPRRDASSLALGVVLFFALSGFLLYRPFAASIARDRELPSARTYLRNRALRIIPAYWVILGIVALVLGAAAVRDSTGALATGELSAPLPLAQAMLFFQGYRPSTVATGIGPAWSLAVEAVFYLLLPVLALGAARLARRAASRRGRMLALLAPPLGLLVVGLSGKLAAGTVVPGPPGSGWDATWHSVIERSFWAQADLFSFGMIGAVVYVEMEHRGLRLGPRWRAAVLGLALLVCVPCAWTLGEGQLSYLPQNTGVALAAALFLFAIVMPQAGRGGHLLQRVLEWRVLVAVGVASYSLFLWHEPLVHWLRVHGLTLSGWLGLVANLLVIAVVAGTLSMLTYRLVEAPALRRKRATGAAARRMSPAQAEAAP
jgi:peptidoglycan/LPS O-acetylase OafA/YrhL